MLNYCTMVLALKCGGCHSPSSSRQLEAIRDYLTNGHMATSLLIMIVNLFTLGCKSKGGVLRIYLDGALALFAHIGSHFCQFVWLLHNFWFILSCLLWGFWIPFQIELQNQKACYYRLLALDKYRLKKHLLTDSWAFHKCWEFRFVWVMIHESWVDHWFDIMLLKTHFA